MQKKQYKPQIMTTSSKEKLVAVYTAVAFVHGGALELWFQRLGMLN